MALIYHTLPLVLGINSFASHMMAAYTSFYLLKCIARLAGYLGIHIIILALTSRVLWQRLERTVKMFVGSHAICLKTEDYTSK